MNTKRAIIAATALILGACGSVAPKSSNLSPMDAEIIVTKRHLASLQQALKRDNMPQARADLAVLKSIWKLDNSDLQKRLQGSLDRQQMETLFPAAKAVTSDPVDREIHRILVEFGEDPGFKVPADFRARVDHWMRHFTSANIRPGFENSLQRMQQHYPMVAKTFAHRHLPEVLAYIPLIESGYQPGARSAAGAAGLWQFMPATAKRYGLKVSHKVDHRIDPRRASVAAREYLLDLILEFGDGHSMLLVMAAYNAGENRIRNRLRRLEDIKDRSFWTLAERSMIPRETADYVPKIIAAAILARHASRYGLTVWPQLAKNP